MNQITQPRILNCDLDAFGGVVREHQAMLLGYVLRGLSDWTLTEGAANSDPRRFVVEASFDRPAIAIIVDDSDSPAVR